MDDWLEEYEKHLVPASDEEIIALAERLWADPALKEAFQRVGCHGDFTEAEADAVEEAIAAYRQGDLWDRDVLHLALAPCLVRQRAAGLIDHFDTAAVRAFLSDRRVTRVGAMFKPAPTRLQEIIDFAKAIQNDPQAWAMIQRVAVHRDAFVHEIDKDGIISRFETSYKYKYGLLNRGHLSLAIGHLRGVVLGLFSDIEGPETIASLERDLARLRPVTRHTNTPKTSKSARSESDANVLAGDGADETLGAWPRRGVALFIWLAFLFGLCLLSGFYIFDTRDLGDFFSWTVKLAPLLIPFAFFFITSSVLLFTWKPLVKIGSDRIEFPHVGLVIHRDEVRRVVAQHNGITENWRVGIELTTPMPRRFRTFLFFPAAFAFGCSVYILPMYLAEPRQQIRDAIVRALSPDER